MTRRDLHYRRRRARRRRRLTLFVVGPAAFALLVLVTGWSQRAPETRVAVPTRPPARPTKAERPPQFVVASFDGAGDAALWHYWREVGRRAGARFTFFLSGVYLLGEERRVLYQPPQHDAGSSAIGFMQRTERASSRRLIGELLVQLAAGHEEGHEIATHFNGHFCAPYVGSVGEWSAADWRQELAQFDELLSRASSLNGLERVELGFGPEDIVGARTPCLEGKLGVLHRVLREYGFRYDSSSSAPLGTWPRRDHGIWSFPLPEIPLAGTNVRVISMDYNFMANQAPDAAKRIEEQTLASYVNAFERSYHGNRAPFAVGNHFARWNDGAYVRALTRFIERACRLPEVRCVPYAEVAQWLDSRPCSARTARLGRIAYLRGDSLHVLDLATCTDRIVAQRANSPVRFSPDGRWIAFGGGAIVSASGGPVRRPVAARVWEWAPRGHVLAAITPGGGVVLGSRRLLPEGWGASALAFARDGSLVVARSRGLGGSIWVLLRPQLTPDLVAAFARGVPELAAVSHGWTAYWLRVGRSNSIAADGLPLDVKDWASGVRGPRLAQATLLHADYVATCGRSLLVTSGAGRYASNNKRLLVATPSTTDRRWTVRDLSRDRTRSWVSPACSPDGRSVAAAAGLHTTGRFGREARSIWRVATEGAVRRRLTRPPAGKSDESPRWAKDGRFVLFVRSGPTRGDATALGSIYLVPSRGGSAIGPFARLGPTGNYYGHYGWPDELDWSG